MISQDATIEEEEGEEEEADEDLTVGLDEPRRSVFLKL